MNDDIERRLHDDAARQPEINPPSLDEAVRAASGRSRRVLTTLSVAATVALVGGIGVAVATQNSGHHAPSGAPLADHLSVDGVLTNRADSTITVYFTVGSCVHDRSFGVHLDSQTSQAVHLAIDPSAGGVSASPVDVTVSAPGTGVVIGTQGGATLSVSGPTGEPTGPTGNPTGPTGGVTGPTGIGTGPTGGPTGSVSEVGSAGYSPVNGTYVPLNQTGAPSSSAASSAPADTCPPMHTYAARLSLAAPLGDRPVYVDGVRQVVIDAGYAADVRPPAGYHVLLDQRLDHGLQHVVLWADRHGHTVNLDYRPPDGVPVAGDVVSHPDVNGQPATLSEASGVRELSWTLPSGALVQLTSSGEPPMTAAQLLAIARGID